MGMSGQGEGGIWVNLAGGNEDYLKWIEIKSQRWCQVE